LPDVLHIPGAAAFYPPWREDVFSWGTNLAQVYIESVGCKVRARGSSMYILKIRGPRNATLAYHKCESYAEVGELSAVYAALGYAPENLIVEEVTEEKAA
jgi:hypothetical protein